MGLDYVDIFYSHRFDPETPLEETMGALDTAVRQGKALYAGISPTPPSRPARPRRSCATSARRSSSTSRRTRMLNRWIEPDLLDALGELGVGCIAFSPLAQGMLTDKYLDGIPEGSRASWPSSLSPDLLTDGSLDKIRALNEIASGRGQTLAQMALAWTLRDARVTSALIGASSVEQLEENARRGASGSTSPTTSSPRSTGTRRTAASTSGRSRAAADSSAVLSETSATSQTRPAPWLRPRKRGKVTSDGQAEERLSQVRSRNRGGGGNRRGQLRRRERCDGSGSSSSSSSAAALPAFAAAGTPAPNGQAPWGMQRSDETPLTGDALSKVEAIAKAKVPNGTIVRVETDADGNAAYEAHMTKSDGTPVTVYVNKDFELVSVETR